MSVSSPVQQRRSVLDFCLSPLRARLGEETGEVPSKLEINGQVLDLDGWEQTALADSVSGATAKPWSALVTEGIAFRVGCRIKLTTRGNDEELITFAAAGYALLAEMQQLIDLLIVAGQVASAKKLTQFRNKLIQDVKQLGEPLDDGALQLAEQASADLIGPPQSSLPVSSSIGPSPKGAGEYKPRKRQSLNLGQELFETDQGREAESRSAEKRRVRAMSGFLFASTLVWLIFFMPRLFEPQAQVLQKPQFEHLPAISNVTARPPSLYVEVRSQAWDALPRPDQQKLLEEVGRIAVAAEYNGVQVKKEQGGAVVGRWLRAQGAQLVSGS